MTAPSGPIRLLIVEDSEDILFIMKTELEWMGYQLDVASDATTGLELARSKPPDVVISDIRMPGIDGFEFIRRLREIPALASVPAIALTGMDRYDGLDAPESAGFDAQLTKPVEPSELVAVIQRLMSERGN